ncbi:MULTISPECIES: TRAP transporter substrate-binding protein [Oceanobacillus]|uniref:ABC transporter substrate-binding protein n=1 Tax=Oceanobacillus kimchii TaxID=746691 RepID=A0ABQ5TEH6_9BACI|nr:MULTISPECIES: TRAP transporter substrate-binding protein [Oceanobacillus]MBT2653156.1 TRAP transporter substrate-binding protein [Oceanobacillus sp. ISL-73]GLO64516.1 ABC transporter substrate-binding protein [Oceanobacillus kimchii]
MIKKLVLFVLLTFLFLNGCSTNQSSAKEEDVTHWKMTHISDSSHLWHRTAVEFANLVEEKTNGKVIIELFPNSQLGSEVDNINSIRYGATDLTITGETLEVWTPNAVMLAVPYAFESNNHMREVIEGDIGEKIENDIKRDIGLTPLFYMERAPRNLTSNYPISTPDDLRGFNMRVPNVPLFLDSWSEAGAQPQVMSLSEVFTGLQQGVIDGQENPNDLIESNGFYEVQNYLNLTEHVRSWIYVVVGTEQLKALPENQQEAVKEAAAEAEKYAQDLLEQETEEVRQRLIDAGMQINEDVDTDAFREAMLPALKEYFKEEQLELYQDILDVADENGGNQ